MTKAIVHAAMGLGWEMAATTPDHTIGTLNLRAHQAVVDIAYDTKSYNIRYKSRTGLPYGEADQTSGQDTRDIYKNYNGLIENLNNAIRTQIVAVES
jgi:hypothetical protein